MLDFSKLISPIFLAPAAWSGQNVNNIGAIYTKTITLEPREGNPGETLKEINPGTLMNWLALKNSGLNYFINKELNQYKSPVIVSIAGTPTELREIVGIIGELIKDRILAIEINLSCPNVQKHEMLNCGMVHRTVYDLIKVCNGVPLMVKLPPWPDHAGMMARTAELAGASAVTAVNTIPGIFEDSFGGISGKQLKPIALKCVYETKQSCNIPVVACGGIFDMNDIKEYSDVGADALAICTAELLNPGTANKLAGEYLNELSL